MLLKHGFLFQANNGGESRPSRLKRRIHGRELGFGATKAHPSPPGRPKSWNGPWTTAERPSWALGLVHKSVGQQQRATCLLRLPVWSGPGYALSHSVLLLLKATSKTPPSSPLC